MTFFGATTNEEQCDNCKAKLKISRIPYPDKEDYCLSCPWCGLVLEKGRERYDYSCILLTDGDPDKQKT